MTLLNVLANIVGCVVVIAAMLATVVLIVAGIWIAVKELKELHDDEDDGWTRNE